MVATLTRRGLGAGALAVAVSAHARAQTTQQPNLAEDLARYAASLSYGDLDPATVEAVKSHLIDALGCGIAALGEPSIKAVRELASEATGRCTLLGSTRQSSLNWATFANGCALREFDLNDFYTGKDTGHPSDNIAACLATGEMYGRTGKDLMTSIVLAYEVVCHLLDGPSLRVRGFDHPAFSLVAVALASGRLMGLSLGQLVQAVNLAVTPNIPLFQTRAETFSNWKGMADPAAARNAVFAAQLAGKDITGPSPVFEGGSGFMKAVSGPFTMDVDGFGGRKGSFRINDVRYKFYPAQAFIQTAIPAAVALHDRIGGAGRITKVEIATTRLGKEIAANAPEKWAPKTAETADHSLPYIVVRALLDGKITVHSYSDAALTDPALTTLLTATTVVEDPALSALMPAKMPNRVTVTLTDGRSFTEQTDNLPGFPGRPMQRTDIEAKFDDNVGPFWSSAQRRRILDACWTLEEQTDLGTFMRSLAPA